MEAKFWSNTAIKRFGSDRARTAVYRNTAGELALVDVGRIGNDERKQVLDKLIAAVNEDMEGILRRVRQRFDVVGLEFPKVEVRFENLKVDALVHVGSRALPTIPNFIFYMTEKHLQKKTMIPDGLPSDITFRFPSAAIGAVVVPKCVYDGLMVK
ncbi:hypothetical protein SASPL_115436 [Salvia splendens]|uniref:Pleiotropic ABC efflux transporter N-terminal domain-containing protein n=1 Tax=Salvia splendens TaxID=180675 RepID=A0A8X8Y807_SALSN|nr:hypothetical protein SASPL_115436 [Salvia splendens]